MITQEMIDRYVSAEADLHQGKVVPQHIREAMALTERQVSQMNPVDQQAVIQALETTRNHVFSARVNASTELYRNDVQVVKEAIARNEEMNHVTREAHNELQHRVATKGIMGQAKGLSVENVKRAKAGLPIRIKTGQTDGRALLRGLAQDSKTIFGKEMNISQVMGAADEIDAAYLSGGDQKVKDLSMINGWSERNPDTLRLVSEDINSMDMAELYSAKLQQDDPDLHFEEYEEVPVHESDEMAIQLREAAYLHANKDNTPADKTEVDKRFDEFWASSQRDKEGRPIHRDFEDDRHLSIAIAMEALEPEDIRAEVGLDEELSETIVEDLKERLDS